MVDKPYPVRKILSGYRLYIQFMGKSKHHRSDSSCSRKKYDVIICGAGSAGSVAAKRISDDFNVSVLLLEMGKNENDNPVVKEPFTFFPELGTIGLFAAGVNPKTTDIMVNSNFLGGPNGVYDQNTFTFHAGQGWGGASNHCYLEAQRSTPGFHSFLSTFAGSFAAEWSPATLNQVYIDMETYDGPANTPNRGYSGPMAIHQANNGSPFTESVLVAARSASNSPLDQALPISSPGDATDYNNDVDLSIMKEFQYYQKPDAFIRSHAGEAFLGPTVVTLDGHGVNGRKLRVISGALVDKVLFDECGSKPVANGVLAIINGKCKEFRARKKVIICAGGLRSPGILERSGIGSSTVLNRAGVRQIYENPNVGATMFTNISNGCVISVDPTVWKPGHQIQMELQIVDTPNPYPNWVRRFHVGLYPGTFPPVEPTNALLKSVGAAIDGANNYLSGGWNVQPTSSGSVHIVNAVPGSAPDINYPVLSTEEDKQMQREYYKFMKRLEAHMTINHQDADFRILYPPPEAFDDDASLDLYAASFQILYDHYSSTCKMGDERTQGGVVDGQLHVYGVKNLMVADNSIFPVCSDGGVLPAMLVGWKAADFCLSTL